MIRTTYFSLAISLLSLACINWTDSQGAEKDPATIISDYKTDPFVTLVIGTEEEGESALEAIRKDWSNSSIPKAIETFRFINNYSLRSELLSTLEDATEQKQFGLSFGNWSEWLWNQEAMYDDSYAAFKADLYSSIDYRFSEYFRSPKAGRIRLDEIVWGGVKQDGIPPLRNPDMITAEKGDYLDDNNEVFGIEVNGEARAYPKRILAWHEMFADTIQGRDLIGVYCTLCGTVILYFTESNGVKYEMGTSGFLYRSNKLMYDKSTSSMWNTFWGEPVLGELVDSGIRLERGSVVNTTWGEWKRRHPTTTVLSLETGHSRDYSEGAAYSEYFATDRLMFKVPERDDRLKNKDEVFTLIEGDSLQHSLAIHTKFLKKNPLYKVEFNGRKLIIVSDRSGGSRAYESMDVNFKDWDRETQLVDSQGRLWTLSESELSNGDKRLARIPSQVAFWFGWNAANNNTRLIK